jgi:hypothetical protein
MKKVKVYRLLGWILFVYGIVGYLAYLLKRALESGIVLSYPSIFGTLTSLVFNVFLWAGLVFLWRADKNENPDRKSMWSKIIGIYFVFSLIVLFTAAVVPILMRVH